MIRSLRAVGSVAAVLALCASIAAASPAHFTIGSATFAANAYMPKSAVYDKNGCHGANASPELHWSGAPNATKSFALVVHDPDAPAPGGWYHWVAYNIPSSVRGFARGVRLPGTELGLSSFGEHAYGGPCPPPGKVHHYHFTLYALNERIAGPSLMLGPQVEAAVRGHVLARTVIVGLYKQ